MNTNTHRRTPTFRNVRRTPTDQEREQFHRNQLTSYKKAINEDEVPVKMKHVRSLIIGTHTIASGSFFWEMVNLNPPFQTHITAWKFCHTLHYILRDGHSAALRTSISRVSKIKSLGEHFSHLSMGYGPLIKRYCELLICKLSFHQHYQAFPGALQVSPEELENIAEHDANNYFEMAVEMLEYLEKILIFYEAVFRTMDPSRANSMTKMGQCRLAPLIPCIQDSSCLYDFIVRILFQLHKAVSEDILSGHRTRFNTLFKKLQIFYNNTRGLQYFKSLIQVPHLPQNPPNFLIEAELHCHVAPVVIMEEEQPDSDTTDFITTESALIDTSEPPPVPPHPHPDVVNSHNGSLMEVMAERESVIDALHEQLKNLRAEIQVARSEASYEQEQLRLKVNDLESTLAELESELLAERQSKESILAQVEAAAASAEAVTKVAEEETKRRMAEEKFNKIKEVYQNLRSEHIALIRTKAEMEKSLDAEKEKVIDEKNRREEAERSKKQMEAQMIDHNQLQQSVDQTQKDREKLECDILSMAQEKEDILLQRDALQMALSEVKQQMTQQLEDVYQELAEAQQAGNSNLEKCISSAADGAMACISYSLSHFDSPIHADIKSTPEYTLLYRPIITESTNSLSKSYKYYLDNRLGAFPLVCDIEKLSHLVSTFLLYGKASCNASPNIDLADGLITNLEELAKFFTQILEALQKREEIDTELESFSNKIQQCCDLIFKCQDFSPSQEDISTIIEREMDIMDQAIKEAVDRFSSLLEESRAKDTGMQLEVNEGILGTCGELMAAVRLLVQRASELQTEIVAAGKGGSSPRDFYKRNHRWTEGLISGAKTVAIACKALVGAADSVVGGKGKFEEVIVSSREIAASSMQLVMASKVKADRSSQRLSNLNVVAKTISSLTGTVVATAESCRDKVTEATTLDFSNLSLHAAKRLEMETHVKMLETEKLLETERAKLAQLRRLHYKLGGELEGWDEEDLNK